MSMFTVLTIAEGRVEHSILDPIRQKDLFQIGPVIH